MLEKLDKESDDNVAPVFRQKLEKLVDSYGLSIQEDTEEMR